MPNVKLLAPCFLGVNLDVLLYGIILSQFVYWRFKCARSEHLGFKVYMYWSMLAATIHSGYTIAFGFNLFLLAENQALEFYQGWWIRGLILFEVGLAGPVEIVYARRAYLLWEKPLWLKIWLSFGFLTFVVIGITIAAVSRPGLSVVHSAPFLVWAITYLAYEASLTMLIARALWQKRSGLVRSDRILRRIIITVAIVIWSRTMSPESTDIFSCLGAPKLWIITCNIVILSRRGLRKRMEVERQLRQNRLNTHPDLQVPPILLHPLPATPDTSGWPGSRSTGVTELKGTYQAGPGDVVEPVYILAREDLEGQAGGTRQLHSAPAADREYMAWEEEIKMQAGETSSAPQLRVDYPATLLDSPQRDRVGSDDTGKLSFGEMLRRTGRYFTLYCLLSRPSMPIAVQSPVPAVGINGFGRIGRAVFRLSLVRDDIRITALNHTALSLEHLLTAILYDSTHGACPQARDLSVCPSDHPDLLPPTPNNPNPSALLWKGQLIHLFSQRDASKVDWKSAGAEYIMESTGKMTTYDKAKVHIEAGGAKKVLISAPSKDCLNVVYGVNHSMYRGDVDVISNASCTTNCLAPIAMVLHRAFGIETGMMTTVHASTSSQKVLDGFSTKDIRSGRSAMGNIIPASTGAASAVVKVLPELAGKFSGMSIRVPVTNVSLVDLTVTLETPVASKEEFIAPFRKAASVAPTLESGKGRLQTPSVPPLGGVLGVSDEKLVSSDYLHSTFSSVVDVDACVMLNERTFKVVSWYDNEYGFSTRMLDLVAYMDRYESIKGTYA